jgi:uncharacterized protein (DUF302 family)
MSEEIRNIRMALEKTLDLPFDEAVERTEIALANEGFGVLSRIDVKATLKKKLDVDFPPYQILGACYPPAAHKALSTEPQIGLLLPCNVVVRQLEDGRTRVEAVNAEAMTAMFPGADLSSVARMVVERLTRVVDAI